MGLVTAAETMRVSLPILNNSHSLTVSNGAPTASQLPSMDSAIDVPNAIVAAASEVGGVRVPPVCGGVGVRVGDGSGGGGGGWVGVQWWV